jgi:hypothetical protein
MLQDVSDTSNIKVNPDYEAAIEESYWKSVHGLKKKGSQGDNGLAPNWLLENLQGDVWQERFLSYAETPEPFTYCLVLLVI